MDNNTIPTEAEEETTVPVPVQTNRQLVYGYDDRFAEDPEFRDAVYWDREALR